VGRTSDSEAEGEELGEGATPSGVAAGEGVGVAGVVSGVTVELGLAAGVVFGAAGVAVATGDPAGVTDALFSGVACVAGVGVVPAAVLGAGVGELEGCPPDGVGGCCSHPASRKLKKARATTKHLIMPACTDARGRGIFKARC
jgi:hypothetical protein